MELLAVFLPLIGAIVVGLFSRSIPAERAQLITTICTGLAGLASAIVFYKVAVLGAPEKIELLRWIDSGTFSVDWTLRIDALTAVMLVVVTWVSTLVHVYSIGYMHHDPHTPRFFAYLSLFTFFMLMLVTSDSFVQLFLGWEGVGLCSYLLIGFWYKKPSANAAAIKAFVVNRVGDFGFALGIFAIYIVFGSVKFDEVFAAAPAKAQEMINLFGFELHAITLICILLFIGAMGKSAQLGLHTWLPDAMEGPTPVSALIHAATMVTAGVFLVARASPLFEYSPDALALVTVVGAVTALFAGTIAITQNDIKKIIAYSTCSQLGYMFFACGVSAYAAGVFHLMTHAFFKALLFLAAGSVIHAMSDEQDIKKMGGIWKKIPYTYAAFWIGSLALAGFPPFAGYFSKDLILESAYAKETGLGHFAYWMGVSAALLTAFYSWRLIFVAFHGKANASKKVMEHIHESPLVILIPLGILAIGAIFSGFGGAKILDMVNPSHEFWKGSIFVLEENNVIEKAHHVELWVKLTPLFAGITGIIIAYALYVLTKGIPEKLSRIPFIYNFLLNKWYFDEIYDFLFVRPAKALGKFFWKAIDGGIIDRFGPNGFAAVSMSFSRQLSKLQTGYLYHYAFVMIVGVILIIGWFLYGSF